MITYDFKNSHIESWLFCSTPEKCQRVLIIFGAYLYHIVNGEGSNVDTHAERLKPTKKASKNNQSLRYGKPFSTSLSNW